MIPSFFVFEDYKYKRRKIRFFSYPFKQINGIRREDVFYYKINKLYNSHREDVYNRAFVTCRVEDIKIENILSAIANTDFRGRTSRLEKNDLPGTSKAIYFVNQDKKIIFFMYDDRGLDIVFDSKASMLEMYKDYSDWILAGTLPKPSSLKENIL